MSQKYYTLITNQGAALLANAAALGIPLRLSKMGVGDGNGKATTPNASQTKLIREVYQAQLNSLTTDEKNPNQIIAELVIPENQGGWFINEIGLYDENNILVAVGNCPATYKPQLSEGSGRTQVIRIIIVVDNINAVALKIDPSVVLATRQYVDDLITSKMTAHEKSTNHPNATTKSKGFVQLNSAIDSNLENQAATPLAVKKVYDLANGAVKKTGDTMTGQLILSKNGLKINYDNKNIMALVTSDDNYSHVFYNAEKKQWLSKLIYNSTTNSWNFQYIDDVTINGKSVLKNGDAIQTFGDLFTTINLNDLTGSNEGIYYQGRNVSAIEERGYPINEAGTLQVFKNGADGAGCCQIYTTYRNARQFIRNYRGGTKTWEGWNEVITTGNSGSFIKKDDYGIGSFVGAPLSNQNDLLEGGCYTTRTTEFPELTEFKNRDDSASLVVFPAATKNWCVEMLAVVNSILPRIFFRCATKNGKQQLYEAITTANVNNYIPIGVPLPWPTNKPPEGWFECNGSWFDKNQFPKLAAAYPNGALPDLRGVFIRGKDNGRGLDPNRAILSYQDDAIRNIYGELSPISESFAANPIASGAFRYFEKHTDHTPAHIDIGSVGGVTFDASRVVATANENRPRNLAFMYIVKAE